MRSASLLIAAAVVVQAGLLVAAALANVFRMNPDQVVYARLSEYFLDENWKFFINGYWGPALPCVIAAARTIGFEWLAATRAAMVFSALAFLGGGVWLFVAAGASRLSIVLGAWVIALAGVGWASHDVTPDLLSGALLAAFIALLTTDSWVSRRPIAFFSGVLLGLAYLAKAIALPIGMGTLVMFAYFHSRRSGQKAATLRSGLMTLGALALLAGPWIVAISVKYGAFTFSTSGRINHATVSREAPGFHPSFLSVHTPERGRLTSWEDPSLLPYRYWSPFESAEAARHQAWLIKDNLYWIRKIFAGFATVNIAWLGPILAVIVAAGSRSPTGNRWRLQLVPLGLTTLAYTLVHAQADRYFFSTFPLVLGIVLGAVEEVLARSRWRNVAVAVICILFAGPQVTRVLEALEGGSNWGSREARHLAERIQRAGVAGPIVGGGSTIDHVGIYLAYLTKQPWHGEVRPFDAGTYANSEARLLVVPRRIEFVKNLAVRRDLRDLDPLLFESPAAAAREPLKIFERVAWQPE